MEGPPPRPWGERAGAIGGRLRPEGATELSLGSRATSVTLGEKKGEVEVWDGGRRRRPRRPPNRFSWGSRSSTPAGGFPHPWRPAAPLLARRRQRGRQRREK